MFGARRVDHAEPGGDFRHVPDVSVATILVQRSRAVEPMGAQEAVGFGDVNPFQQVRIGGLIPPAVGGDPLHPPVDTTDPINGALRVGRCTEGRDR
jgi:hypothetical protein